MNCGIGYLAGCPTWLTKAAPVCFQVENSVNGKMASHTKQFSTLGRDSISCNDRDVMWNSVVTQSIATWCGLKWETRDVQYSSGVILLTTCTEYVSWASEVLVVIRWPTNDPRPTPFVVRCYYNRMVLGKRRKSGCWKESCRDNITVRDGRMR